MPQSSSVKDEFAFLALFLCGDPGYIPSELEFQISLVDNPLRPTPAVQPRFMIQVPALDHIIFLGGKDNVLDVV